MATQNAAAQRKVYFNPRAFLATIKSSAKETRQKDSLSKKAKVRLTVVSEAGKEATLGILSEGDFFGEGGLAGQVTRMSSAIAMTDRVLLHVEKKMIMRTLAREPKLSAMFVKYLLKRNIRYQEDLVDQLFNSSEKRLARVLLLMAQFGREGVSENVRAQTESGDYGGDDWDDSFAGKLLHEPIQEVRRYQIRRWRQSACPQITSQRRSPQRRRCRRDSAGEKYEWPCYETSRSTGRTRRSPR